MPRQCCCRSVVCHHYEWRKMKIKLLRHDYECQLNGFRSVIGILCRSHSDVFYTIWCFFFIWIHFSRDIRWFRWPNDTNIQNLKSNAADEISTIEVEKKLWKICGQRIGSDGNRQSISGVPMKDDSHFLVYVSCFKKRKYATITISNHSIRYFCALLWRKRLHWKWRRQTISIREKKSLIIENWTVTIIFNSAAEVMMQTRNNYAIDIFPWIFNSLTISLERFMYI